MSLLKPTLGDLIDRLAVVELKIEAIEAAGKSGGNHFRVERDGIRLALYPKCDIFRHANLPEVAQLAVAHREMWGLTDRMSRFLDVTPDNALEVGWIGLQLFKLNKRRAELKEAIDRAAGEYQGPEKLS